MRALGDGSYLPDVAAVAAEFAGGATVEREGKDVQVSVSAVTPNFPAVRSWRPTEGQFFTQQDFDERARVVLIGRSGLQ